MFDFNLYVIYSPNLSCSNGIASKAEKNKLINNFEEKKVERRNAVVHYLAFSTNNFRHYSKQDLSSSFSENCNPALPLTYEIHRPCKDTMNTRPLHVQDTVKTAIRQSHLIIHFTLQSFPTIPATSRHIQQWVVISSHSSHFHQCQAISVWRM